MDKITFDFQSLVLFAQTKLINIVVAAIVFLIGNYIIKLVLKPVGKWLVKLKVDISLHAFIISISKITLLTLLAVSCLDMSGLVKATSLVTALGAVGLALSLAVKDSLSNMAGGIMVLFTKPFAIGDYVDVCGQSGTVMQIDILHTTLKTVDNKRIYLPNGDVAKAQIVNYSAEPQRRLDLTFSIGYNNDFKKAEDIIIDVANKSGWALSEPDVPFARVKAHSASCIEIQARIWVNSGDYWNLNFYMYEQVKIAFDEAGISIPFNQLDININKN